ncbi:MAG: aminotransferase class V-fold PLP-dependent enzyme [Verrucomicrobia bacterium]|nr:aminotransferase class V-fold PLP-dependent enzyme [Verrucomicrobiota bacterium]MDA1064872.1 aminotransferase class V-fold PLP-dependent enzyme [Verrucomicrobiota bacterium]
MAYFDNNATTPLNVTARDVLINALDNQWSNPSSPYQQSARVHNALAAARESLALRLKKTSADTVFTGGATEANNSVIQFMFQTLADDQQMLLSPFEHPSVAQSARYHFGNRLHLIRSNPDGVVDLEHFDELLESCNIGAVSIMAVNNETGVVQPIEEIAQRCQREGIYFHCDASQWFGKFPVKAFDQCDFLVGCAHKFGGPKGVGFLALSNKCHGFSSQLGGGQESGKRGGTENVSSILAMVTALESSESELPMMQLQQTYRDQFEKTLSVEIPGISFIGKNAIRAPNTSFLIVPMHENLRWVRKLDVLGFQVSTGSACATGKADSSDVLNALGYPADSGHRSIRVSSWTNSTESDWTALAHAFVAVWGFLQNPANSGSSDVISI